MEGLVYPRFRRLQAIGPGTRSFIECTIIVSPSEVVEHGVKVHPEAGYHLSMQRHFIEKPVGGTLKIAVKVFGMIGTPRFSRYYTERLKVPFSKSTLPDKQIEDPSGKESPL